MKQTLVFVIVVILSVAIVTWIKGSTPPATQGEAKKVEALQVSVIPIVPSAYQVSIPSYGNIQAEDRYEIHTRVSGQVIARSADFRAGAYVTKGDVLLEVEPDDYVLAVSEAKSGLAASELALEEEQARAGQAQRDWKTTSSNTEARAFVLRAPHLKAAQAKVEAAKAALVNAELNLKRTKLRSEFSGRIEEVSVEQGAVVSPNMLLGRGFSAAYGELRLPISTADLPLIYSQALRQKSLDINVINTLVKPEQTWVAEFMRTEAGIDQSSQQLFIIARIKQPFLTPDEPEKVPLLQGQYVRAELKGPPRSGVIVVKNELIYQGSYVYVVTGEARDTLERRLVTVSFRGNEESIIALGLEPGDLLVTTLLGQLTSGTRVEVSP